MIRRFRAPGRVNLIGEHTDYNDGFVMPAALEFETVAEVTRREDRMVFARSAQFAEGLSFPLDETRAVARGVWCDYVQGVALQLELAGYRLEGAELSFDSTVPIGAGLSSSAALEVSAALALAAVAGHAVPKMELARLCQKAESEFVGLQCGMMDQFISLHGEANHAVLLDCRSLEYRAVPLPADVRVVICNTMVKHELTGSEYNSRRQDCQEAAAALGVGSLREIRFEQFEKVCSALPERARRRAAHVIQEIERTGRAADALARGDLKKFGRYMSESHATLRDCYEVSCAELDLMVQIAGKQPGVYGARMTGGGFGGCTVNLVDAAGVDSFRSLVGAEYEQEMGIRPDIYVCAAADGAGELT